MHHLFAFSPDLDADGSPNQMLKSQRLPLPHQTLAQLQQPASCVGPAFNAPGLPLQQAGSLHSPGPQGV